MHQNIQYLFLDSKALSLAKMTQSWHTIHCLFSYYIFFVKRVVLIFQSFIMCFVCIKINCIASDLVSNPTAKNFNSELYTEEKHSKNDACALLVQF